MYSPNSEITQCKLVAVMPPLRKHVSELTSRVRAIRLFVPKMGQKAVIFGIKTLKWDKKATF